VSQEERRAGAYHYYTTMHSRLTTVSVIAAHPILSDPSRAAR